MRVKRSRDPERNAARKSATSRRVRTSGRVAALLAFVPTLCSAQITVGVDLAWRSQSLWRGLERTSRTVVQPAAFAGWTTERWSVAGGIWSSLEPFDPRGDDATVAGEPGLGEVDYWLQGTVRRDRYTSLTVGAIAYGFRARSDSRGLSSEWNTRELYLRVEARALAGLEHELTLWQDVSRVRGTFAEYTVRRALPLFPVVLPPTVVVAGTAGWSANERAMATEAGWFTRDGWRYADLSLGTTPVVSLGGTRAAIAGAIHYQFGRGDAPVPGGSPPLRREWWGSLTISVPATAPGRS